jgi:hypothetical protein
MVGEVTFRTNDSSKTVLDFSSTTASINHTFLLNSSSNGFFNDAARTGSTVGNTRLRWMTAGGAVLATFVAAWAGHLFLTPEQIVEQAMPDVVALLVFLLVSRPG